MDSTLHRGLFYGLWLIVFVLCVVVLADGTHRVQQDRRITNLERALQEHQGDHDVLSWLVTSHIEQASALERLRLELQATRSELARVRRLATPGRF